MGNGHVQKLWSREDKMAVGAGCENIFFTPCSAQGAEQGG